MLAQIEWTPTTLSLAMAAVAALLVVLALVFARFASLSQVQVPVWVPVIVGVVAFVGAGIAAWRYITYVPPLERSPDSPGEEAMMMGMGGGPGEGPGGGGPGGPGMGMMGMGMMGMGMPEAGGEEFQYPGMERRPEQPRAGGRRGNPRFQVIGLLAGLQRAAADPGFPLEEQAARRIVEVLEAFVQKDNPTDEDVQQLLTVLNEAIPEGQKGQLRQAAAQMFQQARQRKEGRRPSLSELAVGALEALRERLQQTPAQEPSEDGAAQTDE